MRKTVALAGFPRLPAILRVLIIGLFFCLEEALSRIPPNRSDQSFMRTLNGEPTSPPPVWLMRQAGRYLPEYRAERAAAGSFLDLCYNPARAAEVTLQPIRRFGFDAAILFADILLLPQALGQNLSFQEGEGPKLDPPVSAADIERFEKQNVHDVLDPVYETVQRVRAGLPDETALIGFAGAPWTVATYMLAGGSVKDPSALRTHYYNDRAFLLALIDLLVDRTVDYLGRQIDAGAQAVQLFDTWAGGLPPDVLNAVSIEPLSRIAGKVKQSYPGTPVILFAKGVGEMSVEYARSPNCDAVGIDHSVRWTWARRFLSPHAVVQGGLDPMLIVRGGDEMTSAAKRLIETFRGVPYVFNAGHGLTPDTPPENVQRLVDAIREA